MPKRRELKDERRIGQIRGLAGKPEAVRPTRRAAQDMARLGLTTAGVCEAICDYLEAGSPVDETVTERAAGHQGKPAYELYPEVNAQDLYVKVGIDESPPEPTLVLISVHERHGSRT